MSWTRPSSAGPRRRTTACPAHARSKGGRRVLTPGPSGETERRGGDVAKKSDIWDPHLPHQQNRLTNRFGLVEGGSLPGFERWGCIISGFRVEGGFSNSHISSGGLNGLFSIFF